MENIYQTILTLRAVRHFTSQPIPEDVTQRILEAGRWTGSAKNTQPWEFVVVQSRETLKKLATCGQYASHLAGAALGIVILTRPGGAGSFDAGRAAQNMMLAAWDEGIGSCIASMYDEAKARSLLGIPEGFQAYTAISFGYPQPGAPRTIEGRSLKDVLANLGRKPLDEIVHREKW